MPRSTFFLASVALAVVAVLVVVQKNRTTGPTSTLTVPADSTLRRVLVTGSNSGLGLDTVRWLAEKDDKLTEIILAVRSQEKGDKAIAQLVERTGRPASLFSVLVVSIGDIADAKAAATKVEGKLDGLVLNAGGMVGGDSKVASGALTMHAVNTLGHAAFLEALIEQGKLSTNAHVVFSGSEASRGIPMLGMSNPEFEAATADAVDKSITDQVVPTDDQIRYGFSKKVMAFYVSALARRHPDLVLLTVSPGGTVGTEAAKHAPWHLKVLVNVAAPYIFVPLGIFHSLETGTERYVTGLYSTAFSSGSFLGSPTDVCSGELQDQAPLYPIFADEAYQEAAFAAVHRHI